jgi:hypothetical protein
MKSLFDHIEYVKGKPHHIRHRVALGVAGSVTALIALAWLVGNYTAGTFALQGSNFAMSTDHEATIATTSEMGSQVAGAASALESARSPIHIEVVDTKLVVPARQPEKTVLPF